LIYHLARFLASLIIKGYLDLQVEGAENIPADGPAIIAANHISYLDPVVVGVLVPRPVYYMAKAELFAYPGFGLLLRMINAFPVRRGGADRGAIRYACSILKQGKILGLFPEGRRMPGGRLGKAKRGVDLLVKQTEAPVVPVAVEGTDRALPPGAKWLYRHKIRVRVGKPIFFSQFSKSNSRDWGPGGDTNRPGAVVMREISSLMQELRVMARK